MAEIEIRVSTGYGPREFIENKITALVGVDNAALDRAIDENTDEIEERIGRQLFQALIAARVKMRERLEPDG